MNLDSKIRRVPNWPKEGVLFYDITTLFEDGDAFRYIVDKITEPYQRQTLNQDLFGAGRKIDKVAGIDARGFLLAAPVAYKLGAGLSLVRKKGKLPYKTVSKDYALEYASNTIEMHEDTIREGEKVLIVDDLIATGGTLSACVDLIKEMKGDIIGISAVIDLPFLGGSEKLKDYNVRTLLSYDSE